MLYLIYRKFHYYSVWFLTLQLCGRFMSYHFDAVVEHSLHDYVINVTELMWGLHWLPIRARIQYKILLLVYKAFTNGSPTYLADMMTSCNPVRSARSSHKVNLLVVPHQKSNKYSEKAFAVVGPRLWNELLTDELRGCNSIDTFKKKLKTMLFKKHY